jgi:hypothetical protein
MSSKWSPSLRFPHQHPLRMSPLPHKPFIYHWYYVAYILTASVNKPQKYVTSTANSKDDSPSWATISQ